MAQKVYQQFANGVDAAVNNRLFFGTSESAGIALIVPATTGNHPSLWNQTGSGVYVAIRSLSLGYVSGNNAPTCLEWAAVESAGSSIGTAAPVVGFTTNTSGATKRSALFGSGQTGSSQVLWSGKTNSYVAAPSFLRPADISLFTGVAATAVAPFTLRVDYDDFMIAPGTVVCLCTQAATTTALFQVKVTWEEIPISQLTANGTT